MQIIQRENLKAIGMVDILIPENSTKEILKTYPKFQEGINITLIS